MYISSRSRMNESGPFSRKQGRECNSVRSWTTTILKIKFQNLRIIVCLRIPAHNFVFYSFQSRTCSRIEPRKYPVKFAWKNLDRSLSFENSSKFPEKTNPEMENMSSGNLSSGIGK